MPEATCAPICVTGGAGFGFPFRSHIVKPLLERGYKVHAAVRDASDVAKHGHLTALPGAADHLHFFSANLLEDDPFHDAIRGCSVVLHTVSPCFAVNCTRENMLDPAIQGTLTVLKTCAQTPSVRRVVLTSSSGAMAISMCTHPPSQYTEADWSPEDLFEKHGILYMLSKTVAERKAREFVASQNPAFDLVVLNPTWMLGQVLQPTRNNSSHEIARYLAGEMKTIPNECKPVVDVRDVAAAHVAAFEKPGAHGRYLLIGWQETERTAPIASAKHIRRTPYQLKWMAATRHPRRCSMTAAAPSRTLASIDHGFNRAAT
ncbi:Aste57867_12892 [Aphanomyces stellatus]|uniref:Aste57867_12892 protein n=1 Tax=Aphanomyces stellatus TaxID=120398 RepID=A0A485KWS2_9STRA|nr:hypothetical protein As57867_012844 [Aphanomyces stellatus]VFT89739.1 Aste57867_12892 [Aphanomyces stellatus]